MNQSDTVGGASAPSLHEAIEHAGGALPVLRNADARPHTFPVAPEFSNWRSEQHAWRSTCALLDQSHHMTDLFVSGPDALTLFKQLGVNSFTNFTPGRAKQFVAVSPDGFLIGDAILFHLADQSFDLVGHPMVLDWVQFHLQTGGHDATCERDENSIVRRSGPPKQFRYELQGPTAGALIEALTGEPLPDIRFFNLGWLNVEGLQVRALRHGMAGQPGFELFGPWEQGERVREALLRVGEGFGLVPAGAKAYSTANLESGWVPSPLPAIFSGDELERYRRWLPARSAGSLGGSLLSSRIEDYYLRPADLGYDRIVAFDHDFVGREALEQLGEPERTKVTLVWNADDVAAAAATLLHEGVPAKYIDMPKARYALYQVDRVLAGGEDVGISHDCGYIANERAFVSLASVELQHARPGTELSVIWGEEPNSTKPQVEPHRQVEIRATVAPAPYVDFARTGYRSNG